MKKTKKITEAVLSGFLLSFLLSVDFTEASISASEAESTFFLQFGHRFHGFGLLHLLIAIVLSAVIWHVGNLKERNPVRKNIWIWISCALLGILNALGQQMYYMDHFPGTFISAFAAFIYAAACAVISYYVVSLTFIYLRYAYHSGKTNEIYQAKKKWFFIAFGIILAGWLPWLITYYPASADWDVYYPISEYLGLMERSNQQPWFYCTTVGLFYKFGLKLGDKNVGMFVYIILRAVAMSGIYALLIIKLRDFGVRKVILVFIILFYAIVPVWGAYAKHAFKDTQGAALFCLYILLTIDCIYEIKSGKHSLWVYIFYSATSLLMALYRNNCIYVAAPTTLLLAIAILVQKNICLKKKLIICLLIFMGIGMYEGYQIYINKVEGVANTPVRESLSIPLQQTARTVRDHGDTITEQERADISAVLDYDRLPEIYDPLLSDPVKWTFIQDRPAIIQYLKTWVKMLFKYPVSYMEAAMGQSYGYYAFTPDQAEYAGNWNCGMTIFNWTKDGRFSADLTCDYIESMENARMVLDDWAKIWHKLPIIGLTDVKAIYTWFVVFLGAVLFKKREWLKLIPVCAFILMILSCCASPVNDCFRYFVPVAAAFPALMLLHPGRTGLKS